MDRANRIKCEINLIGGALGDGSVGTNDGIKRRNDRKTTVEVMRIGLPNGQEGV